MPRAQCAVTTTFLPPPLDLSPPPLIWPHSPGYGDLHVNHLVSLRYNIHIVTNHTMYTRIFSLIDLYAHIVNSARSTYDAFREDTIA